jgi:predicted ATP-dependent serine protease
VSAEDAANDTIAPRLTAVGADLTCVHILDSVKDASGGERNFSLQTDLKNLEAKIEELGDVVMVIIDPVTAYMGDKIDSNQTTAIRAVLGPVAKLAERTDVCFLVITHPTKAAQANGNYRLPLLVEAVTRPLDFSHCVSRLAALRLRFEVCAGDRGGDDAELRFCPLPLWRIFLHVLRRQTPLG